MILNTSIRRNYIYNLTLTLANLFFPLITYTYASRVLMPEGIGQASFASSVVTYFLMFSQLGIPTYGIRICAQEKDNSEKLSKTCKELLLINVFMAALSLTALFFSTLVLQRLYDIRYLILIYSVTIISAVLEMSWLFSGLEQYKFITQRSLIIKCISVVAIFVLVKDRSDVPMYAAVTAGSSLLTGAVNFLYSDKFVNLKKKYRCEFRKHLKPVWIFFLMSVATSIYLNIDTVMLGFMTSDSEVGLYNSAVKIKTLLSGIITALGTVMLPRMSMLISKDDKQTFSEYASKAMNYIFLISIPMVVYFIAYAKECIRLISGDMFLNAVPAMIIIMPTLFFIGVTNILGIQILVPLGQEKSVLYSEIVGAVTDVILNLIFIPKMGAAGAALGTLFAEVSVFVVQIIFMRNSVGTIFKELEYNKIFLSSIIALIIIIIKRTFFESNIVLVELIASSMLFFGSYLTILIVTKERLTKEILNSFKNSAHLLK